MSFNYNASFIAGQFVYDSHLIKYVNEVWEGLGDLNKG
jgi:hypothetical protein